MHKQISSRNLFSVKNIASQQFLCVVGWNLLEYTNISLRKRDSAPWVVFVSEASAANDYANGVRGHSKIRVAADKKTTFLDYVTVNIPIKKQWRTKKFYSSRFCKRIPMQTVVSVDHWSPTLVTISANWLAKNCWIQIATSQMHISAKYAC